MSKRRTLNEMMGGSPTARPITEETASKIVLRGVDGLGKATSAVTDELEGMGPERKRTREYGILQKAHAEIEKAITLLNGAATKLKSIGS
jgi:hypothetical protein